MSKGRSTRLLALSCVVASFVASQTTAAAAIIAYDPFNQGVGPINGTASTSPGVWPSAGQTWSNTSGVAVVSGSLSAPAGVYYGYTPVGNSAQLTNSGSQVSGSRDTGVTYSTSGNEFWFSFLMQPSVNSLENQGLTLSDGGTSQIFFGTTGGGVYQILAFGNESVSGSVDHFANTGAAAQAGTTALLVMHIDSTNRYDIWVNPTGFDHVLGQPTGGSTASLTSNLQGFNITRLNFSGLNDTTAGTPTTIFDEVRVGTTAAAVVPEPNTVALLLAGLGCGAMTLVRRARRRNV